jgi:hypothetical protein
VDVQWHKDKKKFQITFGDDSIEHVTAVNTGDSMSLQVQNGLLQAHCVYGQLVATLDQPIAETLASGTGYVAGAASGLLTSRSATGIGAVTGAAVAGPWGAAVGMGVDKKFVLT